MNLDDKFKTATTDDDDEEDSGTVEANLTGAVAILRECMVMFGFFGDDNLAEDLVDADRTMMLDLAERIRAFVVEVEEEI